jgi:hypothetical protein
MNCKSIREFTLNLLLQALRSRIKITCSLWGQDVTRFFEENQRPQKDNCVKRLC